MKRLLLCITAATAACDADPGLVVSSAIVIDVPAAPGASLPNASSANGAALLSWVEPADSGHQLRFATWNGTTWSAPLTAAAGANWFINWADFPSVISHGRDHLAAHWLQRSGPDTYAYDVMLVQSSDGGASWTPPIRPHTDSTQTEHGFVSMFPIGDSLGIVWLDGRRFAAASTDDEHGSAPGADMTVHFATFPVARADIAANQNVTPAEATGRDVLLDERACDCCQTDAAITSAGPIIVYRDRSPQEVRDIVVSRHVDSGWTAPRPVHNDNWTINACPVNGPQIDVRGDRVAVAWFTAARDTARVNIAFSDDAGASFGSPIRIDDGNPAGRVDVRLLDDDRALVVWLERTGDGAEIHARIVAVTGAAGRSSAIARTDAQRASGFPRMALYDGGVLIAWTEAGSPSHVRAAVLSM